jgi:hypothetical protein
LASYFLREGERSCRYINSSAFSGSNLERYLAIAIPATGNTLTDGADVAETDKIHLAMAASNRYCFPFSPHQYNGLLKIPSSF